MHTTYAVNGLRRGCAIALIRTLLFVHNLRHIGFEIHESHRGDGMVGGSTSSELLICAPTEAMHPFLRSRHESLHTGPGPTRVPARESSPAFCLARPQCKGDDCKEPVPLCRRWRQLEGSAYHNIQLQACEAFAMRSHECDCRMGRCTVLHPYHARFAAVARSHRSYEASFKLFRASTAVNADQYGRRSG